MKFDPSRYGASEPEPIARAIFARSSIVSGSSANQDFIQYHEPSIIQILIIISFFFFLSLAEWASAKVVRAGIIGQIAVGIVFGRPLGDILETEWQETFLALGYVGLILLIFEGGLSARLDLVKQNAVLSTLGAATGVVFPIGLSYLLLYLGFGYGAVETFIIGASLSSTSLGTTFAVMSSASCSIDLSQTRVGAVLVSAAVTDDVVGLVMSSVISDLGNTSGRSTNLGWVVGRPILASILMAILTPLLSKYILVPLFRNFVEKRFAKYRHVSNIMLIAFVLSAFISIAAYAGTSILFGAFLAGMFLSYLPSKHASGPFVVRSREEGETENGKSPTFVHTFELYILDVQTYILAPLFFASIGFAIPFLSLWTGETIWRGIVYSLLMVVAKVFVGLWIPVHDLLWSIDYKPRGEERYTWRSSLAVTALLGCTMVARGEIGLLIIQIGFNNTDYVSEEGFLVAIWAIVLNTIVGPIAVGFLVKAKSAEIAKFKWGLQEVKSEKNTESVDGGVTSRKGPAIERAATEKVQQV